MKRLLAPLLLIVLVHHLPTATLAIGIAVPYQAVQRVCSAVMGRIAMINRAAVIAGMTAAMAVTKQAALAARPRFRTKLFQQHRQLTVFANLTRRTAITLRSIYQSLLPQAIVFVRHSLRAMPVRLNRRYTHQQMIAHVFY